MKQEHVESAASLLKQASFTLRKLAELKSDVPAEKSTHTINLTELKKLANEKAS